MAGSAVSAISKAISALAAAALAFTPFAAQATQASGSDDSATTTGVVKSHTASLSTVNLQPSDAPADGTTPMSARQAQTTVTTYSLTQRLQGLSSVALTWEQHDDGADLATATMRYTDDGNTWSEWTELPAQTADNAREAATDAVYVGKAQQVEVSVTAPADVTIADPQLTVIDSGYQSAHTPSAENTSPQPRAALTQTLYGGVKLHNRESWWAADLPAPSGKIDRSGNWRGAIVHHSVDRNDYTEAEVPVIIQNIYRLHREKNQWPDIGYQLLVDRFGGVWEGHDEGVPDKVVAGSHLVGAQASGFNYSTFGIAVIGEFHLDEEPTEESINAVAAAIAWEFKSLGITDAHDTFQFKGTQQRISGHGDASHRYSIGDTELNKTQCPGTHLSERLDDIRDLTQHYLDQGKPEGGIPVYRLYNTVSGLHHYTTAKGERDTLVTLAGEQNQFIGKGWLSEPVVFYASAEGEPVYRLYDPNDGNHLWTMDANERQHLTSIGWRDEGVAWRVSAQATVPVYRLYYPFNREHLYTTDKGEYDALPARGWRQEGVAWHGM